MVQAGMGRVMAQERAPAKLACCGGGSKLLSLMAMFGRDTAYAMSARARR